MGKMKRIDQQGEHHGCTISRSISQQLRDRTLQCLLIGYPGMRKRMKDWYAAQLPVAGLPRPLVPKGWNGYNSQELPCPWAMCWSELNSSSLRGSFFAHGNSRLFSLVVPEAHHVVSRCTSASETTLTFGRSRFR